MDREVEIGRVYHHFKGNDYIVIALALDCDDLSKKVVYKSVIDNKYWVRDYLEFLSLVDKEKYPDIEQKYRFELKD